MGFPGFKKLTYYMLRILHLIINNIMCFPPHAAWYVLLSPLRKFYPDIYWKIENVMFKALLNFVVMWTNTGGYKILESGDNLTSLHGKNVLLLVNHQSTADIPCVMSALHPKDLVVGNVMWVMDKIFMYTNFGFASLLHGDFFIQQGKEARTEQVGLFKEHLLSTYIPTKKKWLVLFPEGGFLYKRRERSQRYAEKNNLPRLTHVTLPRTGAVNVILDTIGNTHPQNGYKDNALPGQHCIDWIVDMTLAYPGGKALDMHGICIGWWEPRHMMAHYRAYHISEIPLDNSGRTDWLYDRYVEKEKLLDAYYKEETFLDETDDQTRTLPRIKRREVPFDIVGYLIAYVFYGVSFYLSWVYFYGPLWSCLSYVHSFIV